MIKHLVLFQPDGIRIEVSEGAMLSDAMKDAGMKIQFPCGGAGKCGKCAVEIHPATSDPTPQDIRNLRPQDIADGFRLACCTKVDRDMSVLINPNIRVSDGQILIDGVERTFEMDPVVSKQYLELPEPTLEDQTPDLLRIVKALSPGKEDCPDIGLEILRTLPEILRSSEYKVTAISSSAKLTGIEPGDTSSTLYGMAFDIGTTTVVGTIIDLNSGRELSHASRLNAQVIYGEDTISRIKHVIENKNGSVEMSGKIIGVINEIIQESSKKAGIDSDMIYEIVCAGNTTMFHLFFGLDPEGLSKIPFVPVTSASVKINASILGIGINPLGNIVFLPNIAGFVGSDTVGVMLACNYLEPGPAVIAVDVGTNGEIALRVNGSMTVCSTAAGPALEGAELTSGMRAATGAIEHIRITPEKIYLDVIGNTEPTGICGSGIIDAVAELLNAGIVDSYGAIQPKEELEGKIPDYLLERIVIIDDQPAFIFYKSESKGRDVIFSQKDIRQVQLAKGAIRAGINLLLMKSGISLDKLDEILLAGAFGNYIKKSSAQRIGLLPDVPPEKIRFVGNAASTGAKMALLSARVRADADKIRATAKHIELAALPEFMDEFMDTMLFP